MTDLLPCPFCGGTADFDRMGDARMSTIVRCDDCGCSLESGDTSNAGRSWNTRPTPAERPVVQLRGALETLISDLRYQGLIVSRAAFAAVEKAQAALTACPVAKVREASETPVSTRLDEVFCETPDDGCEWPECECRRKEPRTARPSDAAVAYAADVEKMQRQLVRANALIQFLEDEATRYAEMYQPNSDGRNTFVIFRDMISGEIQRLAKTDENKP